MRAVRGHPCPLPNVTPGKMPANRLQDAGAAKLELAA
jgi:hypothetical protein